MSQSSHIKIRLPHVELHALSWGEPTDPLALCLHGFPDSAYTWRQLGPRLAEAGYYVVAPFTRGYAPSTPAADHDYSVEALARDALAIREQIGEPGEAVLIGHDWGGSRRKHCQQTKVELSHVLSPWPFRRSRPCPRKPRIGTANCCGPCSVKPG